ncbi:MAG: glucose-6-phosphate isomerase, partial [Candidatus Omnitrophica bacterium]|nr:glucose-6-phosphate isomerase [Candidatus Omnitrophota bacterium]
PDKQRIVNVGRTPVPCRGTGDLHSVQQNLAEGKNDKTVTFIKIKRFRQDVKVYGTGDFLSGRSYSQLLSLAQEATEWALVQEDRPNCAIILPRVNAFHWGELLFFFEMATAFEGELLNVNAFDQPGVEAYKQYMYYKLGKPGITKETAARIAGNPLLKKARFIF